MRKKVIKNNADIDKIRYKEELKEFEKEVEKLQVNKPSRGKGSSKAKKPEPKLKPAAEAKHSPKEKPDYKRRCVESDKTDSSLNLSSNKINSVEPKMKKDEENFPEYFIKEYTAIFNRNFKSSSLDRNKVMLKWTAFSVEERAMYQRDPTLIKSLVMSDITQILEDAKNKARIPPRTVRENDQFIKRPMNVAKPEPQMLAPKATPPNVIYKPKPMGYQMRTEATTMQPPNDYEGVTLANSTAGNDDYNYNRIFPDGMEPPILDQRNKRNRRLSSIVGVKQSGYGRDNELEELMDNKNPDYYRQDTRKISIDYFQLGYNQEAASADPSRKISDKYMNPK